MSEPWFRMHANIGKRKVTARLMEHAKIDKAKAVGTLAMFWGAVSQHCQGGAIADVPDALLEEWAEWKGKRGVFAAFVRALHSVDGVVNEYEEYSGKLEERREKDRQRKAAYKAKRNDNGSPPDGGGKSGGIPQERRRNSDATIRNDTKRDDTALKATTSVASDDAPAERPRVKAKRTSDAKYPHFPTAVCDASYEHWVETHGPIGYARYRKAIGPTYRGKESDPTFDQLKNAQTAHQEAVDEMTDKDAGFENVEKFAGRLTHWLKLGAMPHSDEWGLLTERGRVLGSKAMREQRLIA